MIKVINAGGNASGPIVVQSMIIQSGSGGSVTITIDGKGSTFTVPAGATVVPFPRGLFIAETISVTGADVVLFLE